MTVIYWPNVRDVLWSILDSLQLPRPAGFSIQSTSDPVGRQMLAALNMAGADLVKRYPHTRLLPDGYWVRGWVGVMQDRVGSDVDELFFDRSLIWAATKWRWQEANGFDYAEAFRQAEDALSRIGAAYTKSTRDKVSY